MLLKWIYYKIYKRIKQKKEGKWAKIANKIIEIIYLGNGISKLIKINKKQFQYKSYKKNINKQKFDSK